MNRLLKTASSIASGLSPIFRFEFLCFALLASALWCGGLSSAEALSKRISGPMPAFGDVSGWFRISPNSQYVIYIADQQTDDALELWSVPLTGNSPPSRLSALLPSGSSVDRFEVSPDGSRVVYIAPQEALNKFEIYAVPTGGGAFTKLNGNLVSGGRVWLFQISPDSRQAWATSRQYSAEMMGSL